MTNPRGDLTCSFCGKSSGESGRLVEGPGVTICASCVELCYETVRTEERDEVSGTGRLPTPHEMRAFLDGYVIGQDDAKRALCVAVYNHYKRVRSSGSTARRAEGVELTKSNILLIGPTGSGKTLLTQTIARILDVPFVIVDATGLTEAGYVGEDVDAILLKLLQAANNDKQRAEQGIVYIDEIDKIARRGDSASSGRDISGEGVQQSLLKVLEGSVVSVSPQAKGSGVPQAGRSYRNQENTQIDTRNILFIVGGAFAGIEKLIESRTSRSAMGFRPHPGETAGNAAGPAAPGLMPSDLVKFGLIPEFVGRLPVVTVLDELDRSTLLQILIEPKNALVKQYELLFEMDGVELEFEPGALAAIADEAVRREMGARGLRGIIEEVLIPVMYDLPSRADVARVIVTEETIRRRGGAVFVPAAEGSMADSGSATVG